MTNPTAALVVRVGFTAEENELIQKVCKTNKVTPEALVRHVTLNALTRYLLERDIQRGLGNARLT